MGAKMSNNEHTPSRIIIDVASYYNRPPAIVDFERLFRYRSLLKFLKSCMSQKNKTSRLKRQIRRANGFVKEGYETDPNINPNQNHMAIRASTEWAMFSHLGIMSDCIVMPIESKDDIPAFEEELNRTGVVEAEIRNSTKMVAVAVWREGECPESVKRSLPKVALTSGEYYDDGLNIHYGVWVSTGMWTEKGDKTVTLRADDLRSIKSLPEIYDAIQNASQEDEE